MSHWRNGANVSYEGEAYRCSGTHRITQGASAETEKDRELDSWRIVEEAT